MDVRDTQNLYRRLGRFLKTLPVEASNEPKEISSLEEAINIPTEETKAITLAKKEESIRAPKVFVVAKSRHYGHDLSFEKYSNCGWQSQLHFSNGGLAVNLLRMDPGKLNRTRHTLSAYQSIDNMRIGEAEVQR